MPLIHGKNREEAEVVDFLDAHFKKINKEKNNRFQVSMSLIPQNKYILDYGCGWGHYAVEMAKKNNKVEAIDFPNEIEICTLYWKNQPNINFSTKKIQDFADETFDIVVSSQVIEHVHNPGTYLSEINRVLKTEGSLVISLPNIINPRYVIPHFNPKYEKRLKEISGIMLNNYDKGNHHINSWDPRHFVTLLASVGFKLEKYLPTEGIPFPMKKPFTYYKNGYVRNWMSRLGLLKNFSYTMHFVFKKTKKITINSND